MIESPQSSFGKKSDSSSSSNKKDDSTLADTITGPEKTKTKTTLPDKTPQKRRENDKPQHEAKSPDVYWPTPDMQLDLGDMMAMIDEKKEKEKENKRPARESGMHLVVTPPTGGDKTPLARNKLQLQERSSRITR